MTSRIFHTSEHLSFISIEHPAGTFAAQAFIQSLPVTGLRDFVVAARILATSLRSGRPPAGRSERIAGSRAGLYELRITPPGRKGPHARLLYFREGNTIVCARGVLKRERLSRREIQLAERAVDEYRARGRENG